MGCTSQGQHRKGVPSEALGWPPAPSHQQNPRGWGGCNGRAHPSRGSGRPPGSSPEAAAFLRWAISSLLRSGNANSRAVWKEVTPP